jgi:polysaccharide biosynthesis transport protein
VEIRDYLRIIRRRWPTVVGTALIVVMAAIGYDANRDPAYESTAALYVSARHAEAGLDYEAGLLAEQRAPSYAALVDTRRLAGAVIDDLGLTESPAGLQRRIGASVAEDTVVIEVRARDASPRTAQAIADAIARTLPSLVAELDAREAGLSSVQLIPLSAGTLPDEPVSMPTRLLLALAAVIGLIVGLAFALVRHRLDPRVGRVEDLPAGTGPVLATVPELRGDVWPSVGTDGSPAAEPFRLLRLNLEAAGLGSTLTSLLVVSPHETAQGARVAYALGASVAETGRRVVVVDADLHPRQGPHHDFRGAAQTGLSAVLSGAAPPHDALERVGPVSLLRSGASVPDPSGLLASPRMADTLGLLGNDADLVLVSPPPLLAASDAAVVSGLVDGTVLVVSGVTSRKAAVRDAVHVLATADAALVGVVFVERPRRRRTRTRARMPGGVPFTVGRGSTDGAASERAATPAGSTVER